MKKPGPDHWQKRCCGNVGRQKNNEDGQSRGRQRGLSLLVPDQMAGISPWGHLSVAARDGLYEQSRYALIPLVMGTFSPVRTLVLKNTKNNIGRQDRAQDPGDKCHKNGKVGVMAPGYPGRVQGREQAQVLQCGVE